MALADDLRSAVSTIFRDAWTKRSGQVVPEPDALRLGNDAIEFDRATVLYADLTGSTAMVDAWGWAFAAEIYKTYLHCAAKLIRAEGGSITSYDGDRVMGIWVGSSQSGPAVRCALKINYAVQNIINPAMKTVYKDRQYEVKQIVGVDTSELRAARTGVRGGNDIVWVGRAANYAAKLTELKVGDVRTWITKEVYDHLNEDCKLSNQNKTPMWTSYTWNAQAGHSIYGSTWTWTI